MSPVSNATARARLALERLRSSVSSGFTRIARVEHWGARLSLAVVGVVLARFPFFTFQFGVASLQKKQPWDNGFEVACISDCRVYGELADGIDANGSFKWTYFPVWPRLIRLFKSAVAPTMSGYSASVILSWIVGVVCGVLLLWFFDRFWKGQARFFGFSRRAWMALFWISIYPHGHFWFQGYSEPLFLSVLLGGLLALQSESLLWAGLLIGLSAVVRPQGVWLPPIWAGLMAMWAYRGKIPWGRAVTAAVASGIGGLGLMCWYWKGAGDPFYYYKIQAYAGYGRKFNLWDGIWNHRPRWDSVMLYLYLSLLGSVRLMRAEGLVAKAVGWFSLAFTEVPLFFGGFYSYVRFLSVSLGMFVVLTEESERSRWRELAVTAFFLSKLAAQVYKSGYHEWVG